MILDHPYSPSQDRIPVLLSLLEPEIVKTILGDLPSAQRAQIQSRLAEFQDAPPPEQLTQDVLDEVSRLLRFAAQANNLATTTATTAPTATRPKPAETAEAELEPDPLDLTGEDPFADLGRMNSLRMAAALRDEMPRTVALVLSCLPEPRAAQIVEELPDEIRTPVMLDLKDKPTAPVALIERLVRATIAKGLKFDRKALMADKEDTDQRLARMLRAMQRARRVEILKELEENDPDAVNRIRQLMYSFEDLKLLEDRSLQRVLGEVDAYSLAVALKSADQELTDKIMQNLSRRARETLVEELNLLGSALEEDAETTAKAKIVQVLIDLDEKGELRMSH